MIVKGMVYGSNIRETRFYKSRKINLELRLEGGGNSAIEEYVIYIFFFLVTDSINKWRGNAMSIQERVHREALVYKRARERT